MRIRRLPQFTVEAYNSELRIRLQALPGEAMATVTVYRLKPNGFYASRLSFSVQQPVSIEQLIAFYGGLVDVEEGVPA